MIDVACGKEQTYCTVRLSLKIGEIIFYTITITDNCQVSR